MSGRGADMPDTMPPAVTLMGAARACATWGIVVRCIVPRRWQSRPILFTRALGDTESPLPTLFPRTIAGASPTRCVIGHYQPILLRVLRQNIIL